MVFANQVGVKGGFASNVAAIEAFPRQPAHFYHHAKP
jgi:hypothetical protein